MEEPRPFLKSVRRFLGNYRLASIGGFIVILFLLTALLAPWVAPKDPNKISIRDSLAPPGSGSGYLLGADHNGRDLTSRIIFGARISLFISFVAVGVATVIGVVLGLLAGWNRRAETPIMRMMDVLLCFPGIITALAIISILGSGIENVIVAIVIYQIPQFARLAHGLTLTVKETTYVTAARSVGAKDGRIMALHILPNIAAPIVVQMSILVPSAILTTAGLSFLGLGVEPPTAEWGSMLQDSLKWSRMAPHLMVFPGIALMLVVFGFNTFGDGLRSALDPRVGNR
jgi:peptide/nickel transport system permease protein